MIARLALLLSAVVIACGEVGPGPLPTSVNSTAAASATRVIDALDRISIATAGWIPTTPTVIVPTWDGSTLAAVAVPIDGSGKTSLFTVAGVTMSSTVPFWDIRRDGGAIVLALVVAGGRRLALIDLAAGTKSWVTPVAQDLRSVAWSYDGGSIYFTSIVATQDAGVTRMRSDGTLLPRLRPPLSAPGVASVVRRETADLMLLGVDQDHVMTAWARDLVTGRERSFAADSSIVAWRATQPRGLVVVGRSIPPPNAGYLALWDDASGTATRILEGGGVGDADFEPGGRRVAVSVTFGPSDPSHLVVVDGGARAELPGTADAGWVRWLDSRILYTVRPPRIDSRAPAVRSELRIVAASGGPSRVLFGTLDYLGVPEVVPR
jgi:hypothetical protein